jgi:transcriptional regulator
MLIHPWDAATGPAEWQNWLATTDRFGILAVNNLDPARAPLVLPLHFTAGGDELLVHLARPNPVWPHLEAATEVRLAVTGDYAHIPAYWRARAGGPDEDGVPTSYYAAVQFLCRPAVVDDPQGKTVRMSPGAVRWAGGWVVLLVLGLHSAGELCRSETAGPAGRRHGGRLRAGPR